ncbi:MAG: hypothetical protein KGN76_10855 [Acidobacteriota bacterium]|nr:hypothetical protein [Acidobacteriota bacterium]
MRQAAIVVVLGLLVLAGPSVVRVHAQDRDGDGHRSFPVFFNPFQKLQQQIDALQAKVDALSGGGSTLEVVDSTGAKMGRVLGVNTGLHATVVGFEANGQIYPFDVQRSSYLGTPLYYAAPGCTGQAYFVSTYTPFPSTALSLPDNTLYGESGPSQVVTVQSLQSGGSCYASGGSMTLVPVDVIANLGTMFTPPFSVKVGQ